MGAPQLAGAPVLDPSVPFRVRSTEGEPLAVRAGDREAEAFRAADPALDGYLILDFDGFDAWFEEDERNVGHPRDPFHRIDIVHRSRHVRVELDGEPLAESSRAVPAVRAAAAGPLLPAGRGRPDGPALAERHAHVLRLQGRGVLPVAMAGADLAWTYREPLREAAEVTDRIAFFNERVDLVVDGERLERPITPWSPR